MSGGAVAGLTAARDEREFTGALHEYSKRYWDTHPFHVRLHAGELTRRELRLWIANRWYYQTRLPQKDAAIVANCPLPDVRRHWVQRIVYQDGGAEGQGGNAQWLELAEAAGLTRDEVLDERHLVSGVRFATDAYVAFARERPWIEAVASSLTELFSPTLLHDRLTVLREHYPWIDASGHAYHVARPETAAEDARHALGVVVAHCTTREAQDAALAALGFKCDVLWGMADAIEYAARRG